MKKRLLLPLCLLSFAFPTLAQEQPIDEMFRVMNMDQQMAGGFEAMLPMIDQMAMKHQLDHNAKEELKAVFRDWFQYDIDRAKIIGQIKALYQQSFTDQEIKEVTRFYQTPTGKKFLEKSTILMQQGAQIGMQEAQVKQAKLMERINAFMSKHGISN